jgi:hypothetical protein
MSPRVNPIPHPGACGATALAAVDLAACLLPHCSMLAAVLLATTCVTVLWAAWAFRNHRYNSTLPNWLGAAFAASSVVLHILCMVCSVGTDCSQSPLLRFPKALVLAVG